AAPRVEPAAAELGLVAGRGRAGRGPAGGAAAAEVAPVGRGAGRRGGAVEGVQVAAGLAVGAGRTGDPVAVASLVVVEQRDGDPVGADLRVQVGHVGGADAVGQVRRVLVLDLVEHDGAAAGRVLMLCDDGVDVGKPLVDVPEISGVVGARGTCAGGHPAREA